MRALDGTASWMCETPLVGDTQRCLVRFAPTPRSLALSARSLAFSHDEGCSWTALDVDGLPIITAALDSATYGAVIVTGTSASTIHPERSGIWLSSDPRTIPLALRFRSHTIELLSVAANAGLQGIYAGGGHLDSNAPALVRSLDGGATWLELAPATDVSAGVVQLLHVDDRDPQHLLLRVAGADRDQLYRSKDGAQTVAAVSEVRGRVRRLIALEGDRVVVFTEDGAPQRLYLGESMGALRDIGVPVAFRDLAAASGALLGLEARSDAEAVIHVSLDQGLSWAAHRGVGRVAQLASCHRELVECVDRCLLMASVGLASSEGCGVLGRTQYDAATPAMSESVPASIVDAGLTPIVESGGCVTSGRTARGSSAFIAIVLWALRYLHRRRVRAS